MPRTRCRLPCPYCGSPDNRALGITGLIETESVAVLLRRYRCRGCGKRWESFEMSNEPVSYTPLEPSDWVVWEPSE